jgi:hypothetical protein
MGQMDGKKKKKQRRGAEINPTPSIAQEFFPLILAELNS